MFSDDKPEPLPWDYFLTEYERDLLKIPIQDLIMKYPNIGREQIEEDLIIILDNQVVFNIKNHLHIR